MGTLDVLVANTFDELPTIEAFGAEGLVEGATVEPGQTVVFEVVATDPNPGDELSYTWTVESSDFSDALAAQSE